MATKAVGISPKTLDQIYAALEKELKVSIHSGSDVEDVYRLPSLNPNFNYATEGGIPLGRWSQFWGNQKGGKTTLAYQLVGVAQRVPDSIETFLMPRIRYYRDVGEQDRVDRLMAELEFYKDRFPDGMICCLYNTEQIYDKKRAQKLGIDTDALKVVESTMIEDVMSVAEATYQKVHFHVIDSTTNCTSYEEQKMEMTDRRRGLDARVWKQTIRKSLRYWNQPNGVGSPPEDFNTGILITQSSINQRTQAEQPVSARYIGHTSAMTLHFQLGRFLWRMEDGQLKEDKPAGADDQSLAGRAEPDGRQVFIHVDKSRVGRLGRVGALQSDFRTGTFDRLWELVNAAVYYDIAKKSGGWYKIDGDDKALQGLKGLRARIDEDPGLQDMIYANLMKHLDE